MKIEIQEGRTGSGAPVWTVVKTQGVRIVSAERFDNLPEAKAWALWS